MPYPFNLKDRNKNVFQCSWCNEMFIGDYEKVRKHELEKHLPFLRRKRKKGKK